MVSLGYCWGWELPGGFLASGGLGDVGGTSGGLGDVGGNSGGLGDVGGTSGGLGDVGGTSGGLGPEKKITTWAGNENLVKNRFFKKTNGSFC